MSIMAAFDRCVESQTSYSNSLHVKLQPARTVQRGATRAQVVSHIEQRKWYHTCTYGVNLEGI